MLDLVDAVLDGAGRAVAEQALLVGPDEGRGQLRSVRPLRYAESTDVDVGLAHSRRRLLNDVEAIACADEVVIHRRVEGDSADEQP